LPATYTLNKIVRPPINIVRPPNNIVRPPNNIVRPPKLIYFLRKAEVRPLNSSPI